MALSKSSRDTGFSGTETVKTSCKAANVICGGLFAGLLLSGCITKQVWVTSIGQEKAYARTTTSALNSDTPSALTAAVLRRFGLLETFEHDPDQCLNELWEKALKDKRRDTLFAVSELCFLRAKALDRPAVLFGDRGRARGAYLASAFAAYHYLLGQRKAPAPTAYDRRFRMACDLYNVALGLSCAGRKGHVSLDSGIRTTPIGEIVLELDLSAIPAIASPTYSVLLADGVAVHGLGTRDRKAGLGTPLFAAAPRDPNRPLRQTVSGTLILDCPELDPKHPLPLRGTLRCYPAGDNQTIVLGGRHVPIEADMTAAVAYGLSDPFVWKLGRRVFRLGQAPLPQGIHLAEPYTPTKIPVVFVHGTMSSIFTWAEMWNTLKADPEIRRRCQFWFFFYDSGSPLLLSASRLRESIRDKLAEVDPEGRDAGLKQMVVIGHSQGGLLTRTCVTESGQELLRALTGKTLDELPLSPADKEIARGLAVFSPMPNIGRVVFIATPHRGSYLATQFARVLIRRLVRLPLAATQVQQLTTRLVERHALPPKFRTLSTSVDGMAPGNAVLQALAELPFGEGVHVHSIIPIKGNAPPAKGKDGVVAYASAHLDGVDSEFIVRDGHSCQGNPLVIEEVRGILLQHLERVEEVAGTRGN